MHILYLSVMTTAKCYGESSAPKVWEYFRLITKMQYYKRNSLQSNSQYLKLILTFFWGKLILTYLPWFISMLSHIAIIVNWPWKGNNKGSICLASFKLVWQSIMLHGFAQRNNVNWIKSDEFAWNTLSLKTLASNMKAMLRNCKHDVI